MMNSVVLQGLIQAWMGQVPTHLEFYSFIIFHQNCFQIQSQEHRFSKFSWGHVPKPHSNSISSKMLSAVRSTLCELSHHCQTLILNSGAI